MLSFQNSTTRTISKYPLSLHTLYTPHALASTPCSKCISYLLMTFFNTFLPSTPSPVLVSDQRNLAAPSAPRLALIPTCHTRVVGSWDPSHATWLIYMESDSSPSSLDSTTSTVSYMLRLRLPLTYNEAALGCLNGRSQVRTLNFLLIPLLMSSNDESTESSMDASDNPAEIMEDSPQQQEESPTSRARPRHTLTSSGDAPKQTSSSQDWLPAEVHCRSHQCAKDKLEVTGNPSDQLKPYNDHGAKQMMEGIHFSVEAKALNKYFWNSNKHWHFAYALTLMHCKTNKLLAFQWHSRTEFLTPSEP